MLRRWFVAWFAALWLAGSAHAESTSIPPSKQPTQGTYRALDRLADAYRDRSVAGIGAVLTADYSFHTFGDDLAGFLAGTDRDSEMRVVRGMLEGSKHDAQVVLAPATSVRLIVDGLSEEPDPEHADSTSHYRVVTVRRFEMHVERADGRTMDTPGSMHVFALVRGDAAVLLPGQPANPDLWYVRRWLEDVSGVRVALAERQGTCGEPQAPVAIDLARPASVPPAALSLGIRALTNPACSALEVRCDLPGTAAAQLEVYDVNGRLVNRREVPVAAPGTLTVEAGAGTRLLPGVYWVRLRQPGYRPAARMVVVAR